MAILDTPDRPATDLTASARRISHRGRVQASVRAGRFGAVVVSHDGPDDGWSVHEGGPDGWTVALHGRVDQSSLRSAAGLLADRLAEEGPGAIRSLNGAFAVVAHHPRSGSTLAARDVFSLRPLFTAESPNGRAFASEPPALLELDGVSEAVDEFAVATMLNGSLELGHRTLYRDVKRLAAGEVWGTYASTPVAIDLFPQPERLDVAAAEAAALYRSHLEQAIRRSIPQSGPIVCDVSGGLDSSTVAVLLAGLASTDRLIAMGHVFDDVPAADERRYIEAVVQALGIEADLFRPWPRTVDALVTEAELHLDVPDDPNRCPDEPLAAWVGRGANRWFTGDGGDDLFFASAGHVVEAVRGGQPIDAWRFARELARRGDWGSSAAGVAWRQGLRPLVRPLVRRTAFARRPVPSPLVNRRWLADIGWRPPEPDPHPEFEGASATILDLLRRPGFSVTTERSERAAARVATEIAAPFCDQGLLQLAIGLPPRLRALGGDTRWLQRSVPELPALVRDRKWKAEFSIQYDEALRVWSDHAAALEAAIARGWLDPDVARAVLDAARRDAELPVSRFAAWAAAGVDVWASIL